VVLDGPGGTRTARVDESDHAIFDGLTVGRGAYTVKATANGETVTSQPIELPASPGVKIMLVFKPDEAAMLAEHDGVARADKKLPAGTVAVSVVDGADKPIVGIAVILAHATAEGGDKVDQQQVKTDAKGEARFAHASATAKDGYLVAAKGDDLQATSSPFRLDDAAGMRLGLRALHATRNASVLTLKTGSHVILEVRDDEVDVVENLILENQATDPFDPGPGGLVFPLPDGAAGAQAAGQAPPQLSVEASRAVWKGVLPPGQTTLSFGFVLPEKDARVALRQKLPVAMEHLLVATDRYEGMDVEGDGLVKSERTGEDGRHFWRIDGPPVPAGGELRLALVGLPHQPATARLAAAAVAIVLALWGLVAAIGPPGGRRDEARERLESRRSELLDELAALDAAPAPGRESRDDRSGRAAEAKREKRRADLVARLEQIYRELDA
jgi:hypothetical protein